MDNKGVLINALQAPSLAQSSQVNNGIMGNNKMTDPKTVIEHLRQISGQEKEVQQFEVDHSYSVHWSKHPDKHVKSRPAKFLFMKNFPRHFMRKRSPSPIDVESVDDNQTPFDYLDAKGKDRDSLGVEPMNVDQADVDELPQLSEEGWTPLMKKMWFLAITILQEDRLARLSYQSNPREAILKHNLLQTTASKFRNLFAGTALWDKNVISWLHKTIVENLGPSYQASYHEAIKYLGQKVSLIDDLQDSD